MVSAHLLQPKIIQKSTSNKTQTTKKQTLNPNKPTTHQINTKHNKQPSKPKNNALFCKKFFLRYFQKFQKNHPRHNIILSIIPHNINNSYTQFSSLKTLPKIHFLKNVFKPSST